MKSFKKSLYPRIILLASTMLITIVSCNNCDKAISKDPQILGGGIFNIGNSCYMNSVLQAIKAFYPDVFDSQRDNLEKIGKELMQNLDKEAGVDEATAKAFFQAVLEAPDFNFKPRPGQMEDAHEFLVALLDKLNFPKARRISTWTHPATKEKKVKLSDNDVWNHLQIALRNDNDHPKTMQEYLDQELQEVLDETFKWQFTDHSTTPGIINHMLLSDLDKLKNKILIIQLKRFRYNRGSSIPEKITCPVKDPFHLVIKKSQLYHALAKPSRSDRKYELVGFIKHAGNKLTSGHYLAYIKKKATWYLHNDQEPGTALALPAIAENAEEAYIYFYRLVE